MLTPGEGPLVGVLANSLTTALTSSALPHSFTRPDDRLKRPKNAVTTTANFLENRRLLFNDLRTTWAASQKSSCFNWN